MIQSSAPSTYQDVQLRLSRIAAGIFFVVVLIIAFFVVPSAHRVRIEQLFEQFPIWPVVSLTVSAAVGGLSAFLFRDLDIHDKFYDSWVIRWRHRYDADVVIPHLLRPYTGRIDPRFWDFVETERRRVMGRLFYPLVADRGGIISENARIRFYQRAIRYWITQIIEMALLVTILVTLLYSTAYAAEGLRMGNLVAVLAGCLATFVVNRWFRRKALVSLRNSTDEEIDEIHANAELADRLEKPLAGLHAYFGLRYPFPPNAPSA